MNNEYPAVEKNRQAGAPSRLEPGPDGLGAREEVANCGGSWLLLAALSRVLPRRSWQAFVVRPEALLRWHRRLVAKHWTYPHRRPGRPAIDSEVRELILRLARENTSWGYLRIVGELRKLGIDISATLVRNILRAAGVPPAPERDQQDWRSFLRAQAETTLACDFLSVDTVLLRRLYVLVFICIGSRRVQYVGCTSNPDGAWRMQQARNLLMDLDDRGQRPRLLIHDRDSKFSRAFDAVFRGERIRVIRTPLRAPNANAHIERWVGSVGASALTGCSSSTADSSSRSSASTSGITTNGAHTGHSIYKRPTRAARPRRTASSRLRPFDDAIGSADSSTNTKRPPREIE